jgi:BACON domain-containing protein
MHLCLSCNQPCNISAIFCESCRLSLLERGTEEQQEPQIEDSQGHNDGDESTLSLVSQPHLEAVSSASLRLAEGERSLLWQGSDSQTIETLREEVEAPAGIGASLAQATNVLVRVAPAVRPRMPTHVRRALLVFCVVGVLALSVDGILLTLSIMRHHIVMQGVKSPTATVVVNTSGTTVATSGAAPSLFVLSSTRLLFTATQGQDLVDPSSQTVALLGGTQKPFSWVLVPVGSLPDWLHLSAMQGNATSKTSAEVVVSVVASQLVPGIYNARLLVKAFDPHGKALRNSPQTLNIVLTVLTPCSLSVTPDKLTFIAVLLTPPTPQTLNITDNGDCVRPIRWQASSDASWLTISSFSGFDGGMITVQASSSGRLIGASTGHITFIATDAHGIPLVGTPVIITATLTVIA